MNMNMKLWTGVLFSLCMLSACHNGENEIIQSQVNTVKVTFTSVIDDGCASRAYDSSWELNDEIGLFMLTHEDNVVKETNVAYVTSNGDGNFVSKSRPIYYPEDGSEVDFIAYYPFDEKIDDYRSYPIDLTSQARQNAIDLMTAVNLTGRSSTSPEGNLQFKHVLAKLVLNLKPSSGSSLKGVKASVLNVKAKGTADLSQGTVAPTDEVSSVIPMAVNAEATRAEAVLLPQLITETLKVRLELNGQAKEIETHISDKIESGVKYVYTVNVNYTGEGIGTDPQADYVGWTETPLITESQLEKPNIKYITHYSGEYYTTSTLKGVEIRNYSMLYDTDLKMAYWVAYPLCSWYMKDPGEGSRTNDWGYDDQLSTSLQPDLKKGIDGYDRGHQIPSADRVRNENNKLINRQTFFYTNMTPQIGQGMNQSIWANLEDAVRGWSSGTDTLYVVTGAMPTTATDQTIRYAKDNSGKNMAVPKYYFKALARKVGGRFQTIGYKLDNKAYSHTNYDACIASVKELEEMTGFTFFPQQPEITDEIKSQKQPWN